MQHPTDMSTGVVESSTGKILTQRFGKWTPQISSPTTSSNRRELIEVHQNSRISYTNSEGEKLEFYKDNDR
jgi:hypothetical protein